MRNILAHVEPGPGLDSVLQCARLVAERFGSYVEGYHMRPGQPDIVAAGADGFVAAAPDLIAGFERETRERANEAAARFEAFREAWGVPRRSRARPGEPCADWRVEDTSGQGAIGSRGRIFDLIVVGRPVEGSATPSTAALETALFETGRPILIAPPEPPAALGERIAIAWNGSTETARAVALGMPLLKRASAVLVLAVEGGMVPGPSVGELAAMLRWHDLEVEERQAARGDRSVGQAMLDEAAAWGADLLFKGAYTQSRLRQLIFGGATSHIFAHATLPVLAAN
jgi:nucleotide-binding universal stress UspA family protein